MKRLERSWMYERFDDNSKRIRVEFVNGVEQFLEHAKQNQDFKEVNKLRCPCTMCRNLKYLGELAVKQHLYTKGFCENYFDWVSHGERVLPNEGASDNNNSSNNIYRDMIIDALGPNTMDILEDPPIIAGEVPNPQVKSFFDMLNAAEKPLYEGSKVSLLEATARITNLKCEYNLAHRCVDGIASLLEDVIPENNLMTRTFYDTKKVLKGLELPHEKIHACPNGCMLFWKHDVTLDKCKKCNSDRYKKNSKGKQVAQKVLTYFPIAPRLQRLYATKNIAREMKWHAESKRVSGTMTHPSDGEAWKHFDATYEKFAEEPRNVRLGLCTDGFAPFGQFGKSYSCWPVMLTPYNLPPWLCMKRQFMFLSLIVPGPKNPKINLDVYLQPLIDELNYLWETGVYTYDVHMKQNFLLKAALMWTINDFPAYGMLSGWSTAGRKACPYCMLKTKAFRLTHANKESWFDCHRPFLCPNHVFRKCKRGFFKGRVVNDSPPPRLSGQEIWEIVSNFPTVIDSSSDDLSKLKARKIGWFKKSIFWDLPYWKSLLIRHNLDVMHIEKNFFEIIIHTVMGVKSKTADTPRSRKDLPRCCVRPNLHVTEEGVMPKAQFTLDKAQKMALCRWVTTVKFPDGYASDLGRCVDLTNLRLFGMKSHDCHVFMERLLPVALKRLLPTNVWNALTEISQFFRDLCASNLKVDDMIRLERNIAEIICKLEKIFPPSLFNSQEHVPVHLPYEAKVGGPVQYRWMYPFERYLNHLKRKIGNKARVEGSICNAYLTEEISNFCSLYFEEHVDTKIKDLDILTKEPKDSHLPELFQLQHHGGTSTKAHTKFLSPEEYDRAHLTVLSNCEILTNYSEMFEAFIIQNYPEANPDDIWSTYEDKFPQWFKTQITPENDDLLRALAKGPVKRVRYWKRYNINGYNFHTYDYGKNKATMNYGVCVSSEAEIDYYGILDEVVELSYYGDQRIYKTILFKCSWMDNSPNGMRVHEQYKLVEVNRNRKYQKYDPFVLAHQVQQVCYLSSPSTKNDGQQWWSVFKVKARSQIDVPLEISTFQLDGTIDPPTLSIIDVDDLIGEDDMEEEEVEEVVEEEEEDDSDYNYDDD